MSDIATLHAQRDETERQIAALELPIMSEIVSYVEGHDVSVAAATLEAYANRLAPGIAKGAVMNCVNMLRACASTVRHAQLIAQQKVAS